jgi:hypothetical protein
MSLSEAEMLLQIIKETYPHKEVEIKKLAGNEWVIFLRARTVFIWSQQDWYENFAPKEKEAIAS